MSIFNRWAIAVLVCVSVLPAQAAQPQPGIAGIASRQATVNFADLAQREARAPLAARAPRAIHAPKAGPKEWPDDTSSPRALAASAPQTDPAPTPLSPATA